MRRAWPILLLIAGGCAKESVPVYPVMDPAQSLTLMAERAQRIHTLSAEGSITLTKASGSSVQLDGALAMRPPGEARLRAWKMNQAVFDLTLNHEGAFIILPDDPEAKKQLRSAGDNIGRFARTW